VVGYSVSNDVAILQAAGVTNLKPISLGSSDTVGNGDSVRALGNAGGTGRLIPASGNVTGLGRSITVSDDQGGSESLRGLIETNAAIRPGDSGGPLLNAAGQVIGMDTAASVGNGVDQTTANQGYAIPIDRALSIAHQIENGESSASVHVGGTAFIGVEATGDSYGDPGASVTGVVPGGPAEAAGLAPGDLITAIGGRMISSPDELSAIVLDQKPGASISTTYLDTEGATRTANLRLTTGPPR
jgi:S1-C subfamily serine protease